jgi:dTDP-4-dehydrorhamnose reductase
LEMKVLITGSKGQLGYELLRTAPADAEVVGVDIDELDIRREDAVERWVADYRPSLVVNAAAYTAVDNAELEPEIARAVNAKGAENIALAARRAAASLIQISTDFVFDGSSGRPYLPNDPPAPVNFYGVSKLEGERAVLRAYAEGSLILRTSWLYSSHGANFVKSMLRLMRERETIEVVDDQVGAPTWARGLAEAVWQLARLDGVPGVLHWSDAGVASWFDFAVAIEEEAYRRGLIPKRVSIRPITTAAYPTPARRPPYSVLDKTSTWDLLGRSAPHWRSALRRMLEEVR